jgi:NTE family protein
MDMAASPRSQTLPRTGLILAGGGARGAYQVGVLKAIAELFPGVANPFPVICGVSVGSINAAFVASQAHDFPSAIERLEHLWLALRSDKVFRTDVAAVTKTAMHWLLTLTVGGIGGGNPMALLHNTPLYHLLVRDIDFAGIERRLEEGALDALAITASSYANGRAMTFFQAADGLPDWRRARRDGVHCRVSADHLMASAALPIIFPPWMVDGDYYGDGSLRLTAPLSPAIHLGAERILVVGTRDRLVETVQGGERHQRSPTLGDIAGHLLDLLFNDNLNEDVERLRRINRTLSLVPRDKAQDSMLRNIEVLIVQPSKNIGEIARRHVREIPWTIRGLLRGAGAWGSGWRVPSYLLFEPGFCGELIELGYADVMARRDEIGAFLAGDAPVQSAEAGASPV